GIKSIQNKKGWKTIREVLRTHDPARVPALVRAACSADTKKHVSRGNGEKSWIPPLLAWACLKAANSLREDAQRQIDEFHGAPPDADPKLPSRVRADLRRLQQQFRECYTTAKTIDPAIARSYKEFFQQPFPSI